MDERGGVKGKGEGGEVTHKLSLNIYSTRLRNQRSNRPLGGWLKEGKEERRKGRMEESRNEGKKGGMEKRRKGGTEERR